MTQDYADFVARFPGYLETTAIDKLRASEYGRVDAQNQVYLDYTGGSLYAQSQLDQHHEMLRRGVFGNPHSANPTSTAMTDLVEQARKYILRYFNAADDYICVFTLNASGALKLVGESFPFAQGGRFLATFDNHNSVNGIREFAHTNGAEVAYAPLTIPELRIDLARLEPLLAEADPAKDNLFVYPAQSNFSGVKHPLKLVAEAQSKGWRVLLDAAAFAPTNVLDLKAVQPDFVSISFYKMFGYPTGVGALSPIRRPAFSILQRPWFAGGTVKFTSVLAREHRFYPNEAAFEDGTLNYLAVPAVEIGLRHLEKIGIEKVSERVRCLTGWMLGELLALRHSNGRAMVRIYGPATTAERGGTITLNVYDDQGRLLEYRRLEELAGKEGISLRTGCFCNPGAGEFAEALTLDELLEANVLTGESDPQSCVRLVRLDGFSKNVGAIRASLGLVSNFADAWRFVRFIAGFRDQTQQTVGDVTFDIASCRVIRDGS